MGGIASSSSKRLNSDITWREGGDSHQIYTNWKEKQTSFRTIYRIHEYLSLFFRSENGVFANYLSKDCFTTLDKVEDVMISEIWFYDDAKW